MFFYIDESGNTGNNLFDSAQPVLSYGVLACETNVDICARRLHGKMLARLGVSQLHANELREEGLLQIVDLLVGLHKQLRFDFDYYFIDKRAFALVTFFDHVFDNVLNPAVPWLWYQTPMRYSVLLNLAVIFDDALLERTWRAASSVKRDEALAALADVLPELLRRIDAAPLDARTKEVFRQTFSWASEYPAHLDFHASSKWQTHYMGPNLVGFQFVLSAIARRLQAKKRKEPLGIVVDRQHQYNAVQRELQTHYQRISESIEAQPFPTRSYMDRDMNREFANMPARPFDVSASSDSIGLQLTDVCLWLFNRVMRGGVDPGLGPFLERLFRRSLSDGIHMQGLANRLSAFEARLPTLQECDPQVARELLDIQETARQAALERHRESLLPQKQ